MKRILIVLILAAAVAEYARAQISGRIYGTDSSTDWTMYVNLTNGQTGYCAFQMDVTLPAGVVIDNVQPMSDRLTEGSDIVLCNDTVSTDFNITYCLLDDVENTYRLMAYNLSNNTINGQSGTAILKFGLHSTEPMNLVQVTASLKDVLFVGSADLTAHSFSNSTALSYRQGDANSSGTVDAGDIETVLAYIYCNSVSTFDSQAADANCSNTVNVADIAGIASFLNGGSFGTVAATTPTTDGNINTENPLLPGYSDYIHADSILAAIDEDMFLPLNLVNESFAVSSFQFSMELPEGVEFVNGSDSYDHSLVPGGWKSYVRTVAGKQATTALVMGYCDNADKFSIKQGFDSIFMKLHLNVTSSAKPGNDSIIFSDMSFTDAQHNEHTVLSGQDRLTADIVLTEVAVVGDVNHDHSVTVTDFIATADDILGFTPQTFNRKAADVNADSYISVSDLTGIANIILFGKATGQAASGAISAYPIKSADFKISVPTESVSSGSSLSLPVSIRNTGTAFSAFQFDIVLPEGVILVDAALSTERTTTRATDLFSWNRLNDHTYRIVSASTTGKLFGGTEGPVAQLSLETGSEWNQNTIDIILKNVEISKNAQPCLIDAVQTKVSIDKATGISHPGADNGSDSYNLGGQRVDNAYRGVVIKDGQKQFKAE